jgi:hypothetical protein
MFFRVLVTSGRFRMNILNCGVSRNLTAVSSYSWVSLGSVSQSLQICKLLMSSSKRKKIFLFTRQTSNRVMWRDKAFLWAHVYAFIVWLAMTHCLLSQTGFIHKALSLCIHINQATAFVPALHEIRNRKVISLSSWPHYPVNSVKIWYLEEGV